MPSFLAQRTGQGDAFDALLPFYLRGIHWILCKCRLGGPVLALATFPSVNPPRFYAFTPYCQDVSSLGHLPPMTFDPLLGRVHCWTFVRECPEWRRWAVSFGVNFVGSGRRFRGRSLGVVRGF